MAPRDFEFQQHRPEWKGSWYGPSLTKQTLRALWHAGRIMTHSRRNGQHVYDLTERVVPPPSSPGAAARPRRVASARSCATATAAWA